MSTAGTSRSPRPGPLRAALVVVAALLAGGETGRADDPPLSSYLGNQSTPAPWAGFVRGVGLGATGTALLQRSAESGDRLDGDCLEQLAAHVADLIAERDVVLPVGGLGSARRQSRVDAFMALIESDKGATWKETVRVQAERLAKLPGGLERVYWQVGNEINSRHYSLTLGTWAGIESGATGEPEAPGVSRDRPRGADGDRERRRGEHRGERRGDHRGEPRGERRRERDRPAPQGGEDTAESPVRCGGELDEGASDERRVAGGSRNDASTIPLYAEYFLAPTVAGLQAAAEGLEQDPGALHVMLGTLANARSDSAQDWLGQLLDYRLEGRFAPELAGRRVYELVDIIAIHYVVSYPGSQWRDSLDDLASRWIGKGSITGLWSTEEIGRARGLRGLGASFSLRVAFRYFDWWRSHGYTPQQGRVNFYGGRLGPAQTQADLALGLLNDTFTSHAVERVAPSQLETDLARGVEVYGMAAPAERHFAYVVFPADTAGAGQLGELRAPAPPGLRSATATLHVFTSGEHRQQSVRAEIEGERLILSDLDTPIDANTTVLVVVEGQG